MKKLLLVAAATAALSTSAFADEGMADTDSKNFYLKGNIGAYLNTTQKQKVDYSKNGDFFRLQSGNKAKAAPSMDLGFGSYVNEQFRVEFSYTHIFNSELKKNYVDLDNDSFNLKSKSSINAFMINGIFDYYNFVSGKLYVGAGLGLAQVKESMTTTMKFGSLNISETQKGKKNNNFAYNIILGSSFKLADGVNLDLQYKWADYGVAKAPKNNNKQLVLSKKLHRRGNAVNIGLRFDI